jgi:hypothetical protein
MVTNTKKYPILGTSLTRKTLSSYIKIIYGNPVNSADQN